MDPMKEKWKSSVAVLVVVVVLYFFSLRVDAHRTAPEPKAKVPASAPADSAPGSNEIPDLQQLG